ncbi:WD40-repeat-containing domain protein, partial [Amanita muscaria]
MLNSPKQLTLKESQYPLQQHNETDQLCQHGILAIPSETLTGITAYLDPPSLLSLSRVSSTLHHHVGQDNTWRRAFASRYLGIGPENDLRDNVSYSVLFRRSERTWKNEFISRFKLERKWENSRSASISHAPLPSAISHIHLMSCQVVLSSSLKYGIVARSLPLNGKVYSGYLSAAANGIGIGGIGNPNLEFAPNASTCAITSRGGSASLLWGFLDGSVAVVYADKVMNPRRVTAQLRQCSLHDQHQGFVSDAAWADDAEVMRGVTGGMDGQVKLWWNSEPLECVWASERQGLVPDPCTKVAIDKGTIAAAFHSGNISLWTGFPFGQQQQQQKQYRHDVAAAQIRNLSIPCPLLRQDDDSIFPTVASLHIDTSDEGIALLVVYNDHPFFYRIKVAVGTTTIETTAFGDPSFGSISCVSPYFAPQPGVGSFVIAGDYLGCISIYDWRASHSPKPIRNFEAHEDGAAVTAITWNGVTLMTGSSRGAIHVWDGLTFIHLRSFAAHPSRRHRPHLPGDEDVDDETIKQIVIDPSQEMFVACAGDRVLAWKAGPLPYVSSGKHRARSAASHAARKNRSSYAKYLEQLEMKETIKESRRMVEQETQTFKRTVNREREHRTKLDTLGLTEAEALEYVL